jgi:hypothetical protein
MSQHAKYAVAVTVLAACILLAVYAWSQLYLAARDRWHRRTERKARDAEQREQREYCLAARRRFRSLTITPAAPEPTPTTRPAEHEGATEAYGAELRAAGQALPSADLRTTGEQMIADHHELAGISDAQDQFSERIMHELRLFCGDDLELFMQLTRWGGAVLDDTGTFNRRDLDRALAGAVK